MTKQATLYLSGSLKDFSGDKKGEKSSRLIRFQLNPSAKDTIESEGIPHTAIFRLEINGRKKTLDYNIKDGDEIRPYPYELLDSPPCDIIYSSPSRFIVDAHLGKLAKTMRLPGLDTTWDIGREEPEIIYRSNKEDRMILTRDVELLKNGDTQYGYWVRSTDPDRQIEELFERFELSAHLAPFSRCMKCNGHLQRVELEKIRDKVPPKVQEWHSRYYQCRNCDQVYWEGSHFKKLREKVDSLTAD